MDENIKTWWLTLDERTLHNHLTERLKLPGTMVTAIKEKVSAIREERRTKKIKRTTISKAWAEILDAARREVQIIRTLKQQIKNSNEPERWSVLCEYETVVMQTLERLKRVQKAGEYTPLAFVKHLQAEGKRRIPNQGRHWVDYVKPSDRTRIEDLFNAMPPSKRGKTKQPFERVVPAHLNRKHRMAMYEQIDEAIGYANQELGMAQDARAQDAVKKRIMDMEEAKFILSKLPRNRILPETWEELALAK